MIPPSGVMMSVNTGPRGITLFLRIAVLANFHAHTSTNICRSVSLIYKIFVEPAEMDHRIR